jgi:branched-chain amino acid transport system substrate-binding protein
VQQGADDRALQEAAAAISASKADVILSTVVGSDTHRFYEACGQAGLFDRGVPVASLTTSETELVGVRPQYRTGHLTAAAYFQSVQSVENTAFLERYRARYGQADVPCVYSETSYFQVHLYAEAMAIAVNDTASTVSKALLSLDLQAPQGSIRIDPETNHLFVRPRIGRSNRDGLFDIVWESAELVKPDPYLVAYDRRIVSGGLLGEGG